MALIEDSLAVYNMVKDMQKEKTELSNVKFQEYIENIFKSSKIVMDNYLQILNKAKHMFETYNTSFDDIIIFLENERVPFRTLRIYIREMVKSDYYSEDIDKKNFVRGILGILQGGLENENVAGRDIEETYHNHTIEDMLFRCNHNLIYINDQNKYELCKNMIEATNEQIKELSNAWSLVCNSYIRLKEK